MGRNKTANFPLPHWKGIGGKLRQIVIIGKLQFAAVVKKNGAKKNAQLGFFTIYQKHSLREWRRAMFNLSRRPKKCN